MEVYVKTCGGVEALQLRPCTIDPESYEIAPSEVLVHNTYAGVNFIDTYFRSGLYPSAKMPYVPGSEGAGQVVKVGSEAGQGMDLLGKRVAYFGGSGSYAPYTAVSATAIFPLPDYVDDATAAAVLTQGLTAHYLSHDSFACGPESTVVVHAAAGGTGLLLCQMCKLRGATVIGVCGGAEKVARAERIGRADYVVDYAALGARWPEKIKELAPRGVDAVYDGVGAATFEGSLSVLRPRGYMISFGNASGAVPPVSPLTLMKSGSIYLQRPTLQSYILTGPERERRARELFDMLKKKQLSVTVDSVWPLEQAGKAHEHIESRKSSGKLLLRIDAQ